jgi:hypothetical protein
MHHNKTSLFKRNPKTGRYELTEANDISETQEQIISGNTENLNFKNSFADFLKGLKTMKESEVKITLYSLAQ